MNDLPGGHWNLESGKILKYIESAQITVVDDGSAYDDI